MGRFRDDLKYEEDCYEEIVKPLLRKKGVDSVFIRYSAASENIVYNSLQKKHDIDILIDNFKENFTLSIKSTRAIYDRVFFETVKNMNTKVAGWGYTSKADYIFFIMRNKEKTEHKLTIFKTDEVLSSLDLDDYAEGYGKTYADSGQLLYRTKGILIPIEDLKTYSL